MVRRRKVIILCFYTDITVMVDWVFKISSVFVLCLLLVMFQYHIFNDHLTLCVAQRPSHFVCCSTTVLHCVLQVHRPPVQVSVPAFWPLFQRPGVGRRDVQLSLSGRGTVLRGGRGRGENVQHVLRPRLVRVSSPFLSRFPPSCLALSTTCTSVESQWAINLSCCLAKKGSL